MTEDGGNALPAIDATERSPEPAPVYAVNERFFGMLGMARRAGKTLIGTEPVLAGVRAKNKPALVVISSFASENTKKKIIAKCDHYGVPFVVVDVDGEELGRRLGKTGFVAASAVLDPALAKEIANACTCKGRKSPPDGDGSTGNRG